jgi:hypothetical protein
MGKCDFVNLGFDRIAHGFIGVTDAGHGRAATGIQISAAIGVDQIVSVSTNYRWKNGIQRAMKNKSHAVSVLHLEHCFVY